MKIIFRDWIKVWSGNIFNRDYARLTDSAFRRLHEMNMIAALHPSRDGSLIDISDMAFDLRVREETIRADLVELEEAGFVEMRDGVPFLMKFAVEQYATVSRPHIPQKIRDFVMNRDMGKCRYCGNNGNHLDHVFPHARGGEDSVHNLVCACEHCNKSKGCRTPEEAGMSLMELPY